MNTSRWRDAHEKSPSCGRAFFIVELTRTALLPANRYAVASQYSALNGLLMRSAKGDTSNNLSVGILSPCVGCQVDAGQRLVGLITICSS